MSWFIVSPTMIIVPPAINKEKFLSMNPNLKLFMLVLMLLVISILLVTPS